MKYSIRQFRSHFLVLFDPICDSCVFVCVCVRVRARVCVCVLVHVFMFVRAHLWRLLRNGHDL